MTTPSQVLDVGRIVKPQGLKGEVVVELFTNRLERVAPGAVLHTDSGDLVIARSRAHQHRWVVAFAGCETREDAERLRGTVLRAETLDDPGALWVHELVGAVVIEVDGTERGDITGVIANPASDMLELRSGALVPLHFVVRSEDGVVTVDVPDGLFDL